MEQEPVIYYTCSNPDSTWLGHLHIIAINATVCQQVKQHPPLIRGTLILATSIMSSPGLTFDL